MKLEHVAIWTTHLDRMKEYYTRFFGGIPNNKYINDAKEFESYFLSFQSGARLELMYMPGIPANQNDTVRAQHKGIIHMAFGAQSMLEVDTKAKQLKAAGYPILNGPRVTGDGYYEFETLDPEHNRIEVTFKVNT
jgi:lactoylglutathione lyase